MGNDRISSSHSAQDEMKQKAIRVKDDDGVAPDEENDMEEEVGEEEEGLRTTSPMSSSPPNEFDVNIEGQYIRLQDNYDDADDEPAMDNQSTSLASSLSIESDHEYATSPVILTTQTMATMTTTRRVIRCPVCEKPMRTFYCAKCIQQGRFVTLDREINDQLSETRLKYISDSKLPEDVSSQCQIETTTVVNEEKMLEEMLQIKLRTLTKKTETLKTLYDDRKLKLEETKNLLLETKRQLEAEKKSYRSKESKIELIKRYIESRKASVRKRRAAELEYQEDLKQHVSRRVYQLIQDIFPIEEINLYEQQNSSFVNMETSPLLTFSDGSHHHIEQQSGYSIVEPWLPSNGDYSSYSLWVNDNKDQIPTPVDDDISERNPAFRIGAALSYTTQLVKNLASYLDVILPARMELDMFGGELLNDSQFSYNVAKLNTNVLHLCLSQGIDISLLNPHRTLKNLMLLFNINLCALGRKPILEIDNEEAAIRIQEQLSKDLALVRDEFYDFSKFAADEDDDDDASDSEWEISDSINTMEVQMANEQSAIQQNSSYMSRLPSLRLIASFWSGN